jgi:hypothetical protein
MVQASEKPVAIFRILSIDFSKAFHLIDSDVSAQKFVDNNFPCYITARSVDFLYVNGLLKLMVLFSYSSNSCWYLPGTVAGPNDFKLRVSDLSLNLVT